MKNYKKIDVENLQFNNCCGYSNFYKNKVDIEQQFGLYNYMNGSDVLEVSTYSNVDGEQNTDTENSRQQVVTERLNQIQSAYAVGGDLLSSLIQRRNEYLNPETAEQLQNQANEQKPEPENKTKKYLIIGAVSVTVVALGILIYKKLS